MTPLLLLLLAPAAPPAAVPPPAFAAGDELVYTGKVEEVADRADVRYRRTSAVEVRVFALTAGRGGADLAVLTTVRTLEDAHVAAAVKAVTGTGPEKDVPPAVRLALVRLDARGRPRLLLPPPGPPVALTSRTPTADPPPIDADGPPAVELAMFAPLPPDAPVVGSAWAEDGANWAAKAEAVWNGAQVVELAGTRQSAAGRSGWKRTDQVWVSAADGLARVVRWEAERTEGRRTVGTVTAAYEMKPPTPHRGAAYARVRREVEAAYSLAAASDPLLPDAVKHGPKRFETVIARAEQFMADGEPTAYRPAVEAVVRRCEAALRGELPAVAAASYVVPPAVAEVGRPAPDFAAGSFKLSAARGSPVVLVFLKPGSKTAAATTAVAEALHAKFAGKATVVPLAVFAPPPDGGKLPVRDGSAARASYQVDTYPRFLVIDAAGVLRWQFEGYGPEVGFLVKTEVEKLVK